MLQFIFLTDSDENIRNKIKRAVTDSGSDIRYDASRPGIANLMELYHIATDTPLARIEDEFIGRGYGDFKNAVADAVVSYVAPVRDRFTSIREDVPALKEVLARGAEQAQRRARKTLQKVYRKIGFWSE